MLRYSFDTFSILFFTVFRYVFVTFWDSRTAPQIPMFQNTPTMLQEYPKGCHGGAGIAPPIQLFDGYMAFQRPRTHVSRFWWTSHYILCL